MAGGRGLGFCGWAVTLLAHGDSQAQGSHRPLTLNTPAKTRTETRSPAPPVSMKLVVSSSVKPLKGGCPTSISYVTAPRAQASAWQQQGEVAGGMRVKSINHETGIRDLKRVAVRQGATSPCVRLQGAGMEVRRWVRARGKSVLVYRS